jgi:hypothetical protein
MKKIVKLSEEKLEKIISTIIEQVQNLDDYADEDFIEAFLVTFRQWVTEKLGDESKKYPLSYLLRKYGNEFEKSMDFSTGYDREYSGLDKFRMVAAGKNIVRKGKFYLPSLSPTTKFTEKYKKLLSHFFEGINMPDYVSLDIQENEPNKVYLKFSADFQKMITDQESGRSINPDSILFKLKDFLKNYGGVEFGNPIYGEVQMRASKLEYIGLDEWVKKVLNKKLKKEIKALPHGNWIHSIRFEPYGGSAEMKIIFKDDFRYNLRNKVLSDIKEYLTSQGYNPEVLKVVS